MNETMNGGSSSASSAKRAEEVLRERLWRRVNDARLDDWRRVNAIRNDYPRERADAILREEILRDFRRLCAVNGIRA